jgi:hypothetical protein
LGYYWDRLFEGRTCIPHPHQFHCHSICLSPLTSFQMEWTYHLTHEPTLGSDIDRHKSTITHPTCHPKWLTHSTTKPKLSKE